MKLEPPLSNYKNDSYAKFRTCQIHIYQQIFYISLPRYCITLTLELYMHTGTLKLGLWQFILPDPCRKWLGIFGIFIASQYGLVTALSIDQIWVFLPEIQAATSGSFSNHDVCRYLAFKAVISNMSGDTLQWNMINACLLPDMYIHLPSATELIFSGLWIFLVRDKSNQHFKNGI